MVSLEVSVLLVVFNSLLVCGFHNHPYYGAPHAPLNNLGNFGMELEQMLDNFDPWRPSSFQAPVFEPELYRMPPHYSPFAYGRSPHFCGEMPYPYTRMPHSYYDHLISPADVLTRPVKNVVMYAEDSKPKKYGAADSEPTEVANALKEAETAFVHSKQYPEVIREEISAENATDEMPLFGDEVMMDEPDNLLLPTDESAESISLDDASKAARWEMPGFGIRPNYAPYWPGGYNYLAPFPVYYRGRNDAESLNHQPQLKKQGRRALEQIKKIRRKRRAYFTSYDSSELSDPELKLEKSSHPSHGSRKHTHHTQKKPHKVVVQHLQLPPFDDLYQKLREKAEYFYDGRKYKFRNHNGRSKSIPGHKHHKHYNHRTKRILTHSIAPDY